jgi:hypothetical protein
MASGIIKVKLRDQREGTWIPIAEWPHILDLDAYPLHAKASLLLLQADGYPVERKRWYNKHGIFVEGWLPHECWTLAERARGLRYDRDLRP